MLLFFNFLTFLFFVLADPTPSAPGPGDTFNEGTDCSFAWAGDSNTASTLWKQMNVELMTGSNFAMVHLTTVASNLDGTTSGTHAYPCPQVTPNSAIYFYQFSSPQSPNLTWTTRFTIADATGKSTPPAQPKQPNTGDPIPWGTGALVDPTTAVPAPVIGGSTPNASSSTSSVNVTAPSSSSSSSSAVLQPTTALAAAASSTLSTSTASTDGTGSSSAAAPSSTVTTTSDAAGLSPDARWQALAALAATAVAFAVLL